MDIGLVGNRKTLSAGELGPREFGLVYLAGLPL